MGSDEAAGQRGRRTTPAATWPNLFLTGVAKSGTSSLCRYLGQHPDIFVPTIKEPGYFSAAPLARAVRNRDAYLQLFASGAGCHYRLDASVAYFWDPQAPQAIREEVPGAWALVILRDPVDRAYSHYWHAVRNGAEPRTFDQAVRDELAGRRPLRGVRPAEPYVRRSRYGDGIVRLQEAFGDRLLVVLFEELRTAPRPGLARLFRLLGLDEAPAARIDLAPLNESSAPRNRLTATLLRSSGARSLARRMTPPRLRGSVEQRLSVPAVRPPMAEQTVALLRREYEPESERLQELLGRKVPW